MNVISKKTLRKFYSSHAKAQGPMEDWFKVCVSAEWANFADVRSMMASVDQVGDRLVFNIGGNNFRIICGISYAGKTMFIKWFGTHAEYDKLDVRTL